MDKSDLLLEKKDASIENTGGAQGNEDQYRSIFTDSPIPMLEGDFSDVKKYIDGLRSIGVKDFRAYFENHPEIVVNCASMVKGVEVNKTAWEYYNIGRKDDFQESIDTVFGEEAYEIFKEGLITISEGKNSFEREAITQTTSGEIEHVVLKWNTITSYDETSIRVIVSLVNIIGRNRVEEELLLLQKINNMLNSGLGPEKVFKTIVNGLRSFYDYDSVAIHLLSRDERHLLIKSYSSDSKIARKLEKLTGLTLQEYKAPLYEGSILKRIIDTKKPVITDDITQVLKSYTDKKPLHRLAKIGAKLTEAKWGMGIPLLSGDKVVGTIGCGCKEKPTNEDIQRLAVFGVQAGRAIEKAQTFNRLESAYKELKQSNKLKNLFIDLMRHDLLNPASAAKNMADLALKRESNPDKKEVLNVIQSASERIIDMIKDASVLATLESGEKMEVEEVDIYELLIKAVEELTYLADEKDISIKIPEKREYKTRANPLVYNVFSNLINNAIKYGPKKSEVLVGIEDEGPSWKISVADNGIGISDEYKEVIFDRFRRIKKGEVKGTGLGLAIVKSVVEVHQGRAWVEDNPGGGSIFNVTIPKSIHDIEGQRSESGEIFQKDQEVGWHEVFNTLDEGISVVDTKHTILRANKAFAQIVGIPQNKLIGRKCYEVIHRTDSPPMSCPHGTTVKTKQPVSTEVNEPHLGKSTFLSSTSPVLDNNGEVKRVVLTLKDITDQKRSEKEFKIANLDLKELDKMKDQFLQNVTHELRTPITAMLTTTRLIKDTVEDNRLKELLELNERSTWRLNRIVGDLLDVGMIERGVKELKLEPVEIKDLIYDALADIQTLVYDRQLNVEFKSEKNIPTVIADKDSVYRLVSNILDNAVKFNQNGGLLGVDLSSNDGFLEVSVKDTGIGIEEKDQKKVFERFYQVDGTTSRRYQGTGIGLSLTKKLVEMHGGRIWLESEPGDWTRVTFTLPVGG